MHTREKIVCCLLVTPYIVILENFSANLAAKIEIFYLFDIFDALILFGKQWQGILTKNVSEI